MLNCISNPAVTRSSFSLLLPWRLTKPSPGKARFVTLSNFSLMSSLFAIEYAKYTPQEFSLLRPCSSSYFSTAWLCQSIRLPFFLSILHLNVMAQILLLLVYVFNFTPLCFCLFRLCGYVSLSLSLSLSFFLSLSLSFSFAPFFHSSFIVQMCLG